MKAIVEVLKEQLKYAIENLDAGNSNMNDEELLKVAEAISIINKCIPRISKAQACEQILHCSPATFDNYVRMGIIPKGQKRLGFNELSWTMKDFEGVKLQRKYNRKKKI